MLWKSSAFFRNHGHGSWKSGPTTPDAHKVGRGGKYFFWLPTLTSDIFAASLPNSMVTTSFERSITYLFVDRRPRLWHMTFAQNNPNNKKVVISCNFYFVLPFLSKLFIQQQEILNNKNGLQLILITWVIFAVCIYVHNTLIKQKMIT